MVFESRLSCLKYPTSIDPTVAIGRTINIIFEFRKPPDEEQVENIFFLSLEGPRQGNRLSISDDIWILSSDTDTICQLNKYF